MALPNKNAKTAFYDSDLSISRLHWELFSPAESVFIPEFCKLFLLRSSSFKGQVLDCKADPRISHVFSLSLHKASLERKIKVIQKLKIAVHLFLHILLPLTLYPIH